MQELIEELTDNLIRDFHQIIHIMLNIQATSWEEQRFWLNHAIKKKTTRFPPELSVQCFKKTPVIRAAIAFVWFTEIQLPIFWDWTLLEGRKCIIK